jgi:intein/homing endonuclease
MKAIPREVCLIANPVETTRHLRVGINEKNVLKAYLWGAVHDGTYSLLHNTWRISQSNIAWLRRIKKFLKQLGYRSWLYQEGSDRKVFVIETGANFLSSPKSLKAMQKQEKIAYIRGYFDAEGGVPRNDDSFMYIQICQKNHHELKQIVLILKSLGIKCGKIHNPSRKVDPNYWRFFISRKSHFDFANIISSWHPRKSNILKTRMKIWQKVAYHYPRRLG